MICYFLRRTNPNYRYYNSQYKSIICFTVDCKTTMSAKQYLHNYNGDGTAPYCAISVPHSCVKKVFNISKLEAIVDKAWPLPWPE
jgi:hypothetical protein